ncbi:DNA modification methylase [Limnoglobus roseus]|uniref:Methyltransferase n=1 Tax=Limnoglobus roseus TaxID=2598579 RepID=A0A5C1ANR9_9BACT|nr:DNA modification methylase [Limnoglobus roseus]QEL20640.1 DNA modification methylase [Limnoglobus roseus]
MLVQMRDISSITPYADNPRVNDAAVDAVAESIATFGWQQPLVLDAHGVIVVGHTRYKAALKLGLTVVPVHVATDLTPAQAKAYRLADNRTAAIATWDDGKLVAELLALQGTDVDLASIGFTADELADLLKADEPAHPGDPDAVPDPPAEPVTRPGDVWLLGRHRLLCGDATNPADLATVLDGAPADLLLTDPPYNVAYEGKTADKLTLANDAMAGGDYRRFLARALAAANGVLRPGAAFYLWHADFEGLTVRTACADAGLRVRQCLVWVKSAFALGRFDYHWKHEPCLYGWADGAAHTWLSDRTQTTVLEFDRPAKNDVHPTMKPVDLFAYLVGNSCPAAGVVLDPFAGSGTTLVAAEHTGRTAALVELDPRYCDVVVRRYEDLTGQTAERVPAADAVLATA